MTADLPPLACGVRLLLLWTIHRHRQRFNGQYPRSIMLHPDSYAELLGDGTVDRPSLDKTSTVMFNGVPVYPMRWGNSFVNANGFVEPL